MSSAASVNQKLEERLTHMRDMLEVVCSRLRLEVAKLELEDDPVNPVYDEADYVLSRDPASGGDTLVGIWRDAQSHKLGEMLFHSDGSFFAEYDVVRQHPTRKRWFIESVTAWGRGSHIKSELRLLPMAEEHEP